MVAASSARNAHSAIASSSIPKKVSASSTACASVRREDRSRLLEEGLASRQREQRQLQQDQRVHGVGLVERELRGDRRAARVARDVSARHAEMPEQRRGIGRVVADAHRRRRVGAARPTPLVVPDQLVAGERRF
jgi:hypothetical protein